MLVGDGPQAGTRPPLLVTEVPGPRSRELARRLERVESPVFAARRQARATTDATHSPIVLMSGHGSNVFDADHNRYLDLAAGFGTAILGHGPSAAHAAALAQCGVLVQGLGDLYGTEIKIELLEQLSELVPVDGAKVMLGQSGADAVTIALKTAVLATGRPGVLAFEGAYHGLSYAPLAACGFAASFREPFAEQLQDFVRFLPLPGQQAEACLERAKTELAGGSIGALLVEPILGRGGVCLFPSGFVDKLCALARAHGALVIADEIWTGMGRTGEFFASSSWSSPPDLWCIGKGLGGSFPISACIGSDHVMQAWASEGKVMHTSTHAGAPLGCAAAVATLAALKDQQLGERARRVGSALRASLRQALNGAVREVRGEGLMLGIELDRPGQAMALHRALLTRGYLTTVGGTAGEVLVLTPPLTIDQALCLQIGPAMADSLAEISGPTSTA